MQETNNTRLSIPELAIFCLQEPLIRVKIKDLSKIKTESEVPGFRSNSNASNWCQYPVHCAFV